MNSVAWAGIIRGLKLTLTSKTHACLQMWALSSFVVSPFQLVHVLRWLDFSVQETPQMLREENKKIYCCMTSCLTSQSCLEINVQEGMGSCKCVVLFVFLYFSLLHFSVCNNLFYRFLKPENIFQ